MSFTHDDQILTPTIDKLVPALEEMRERVNNRLRDPEEWSTTHLLELRDWDTRLRDMAIDLRELRGSTP